MNNEINGFSLYKLQKKVTVKQKINRVETHCSAGTSLPRSRFLDVTQRSPKRALRDIHKNGCEGD